MGIKKILAGIGGSLLLTMSVPVMVLAATSTVTPTNNQGWVFNPDSNNTTPYEFRDDQASIGAGSLYVLPIGSTPAHKFIALKTLGVPTDVLDSISYDFLIGGNGEATDANQFYLNVYTNLQGSTTFYDCRYDYVPTTGSTTEFTTALFDATSVPTSVGDRTSGGDTFDCPDTLAEMPTGSTISGFTLNVGDTSADDTGLAGYLDNVVVATVNSTTTYDFEPYQVAASKEQCKKDGYKTLTDASGQSFKNQGDCVSFVATAEKNAASGLAQF
jgi:hypothetical protein